MFAGPVLQFRIQTVAHDENRGLLVVVDGVAHVNAHEHGVVTFPGGDDEVIFVFELNYPRGEVH